KSKNVHLLYREVKARFKKKVKVDEKLNESDHKSKYTFEKVADLQWYDKLEEVDFRKNSFSFLKQSVCDFLYTSSEHISNIVTLEIEKDKTYLVKGKLNTSKVTFYND
uniref:hypothetical protein n=1 Tax=uncultured Eudoraea sp. TaxID=1035614 RepID=UPI002617D754